MSLKTSLFFLLAFVFSGCASSSYVMKETAVNATLVPLELGNSGNQTYTLAANGVFSEQWESYVAGSFNAEAPEAMNLK